MTGRTISHCQILEKLGDVDWVWPDAGGAPAEAK